MSNRRKKYLLNPKFQLKIMAYFLAFTLFNLVIYYVAIHLFFFRFETIATELGIPENHVFFRFLSEQKSVMNLIFLASSIFTISSLSLIGLMISHRIAGPIYSLCQYLKNFGVGSGEEFELREGDFFQELPQNVNEFVKDHVKDVNKSSKAA
jgi:hypothetical protein